MAEKTNTPHKHHYVPQFLLRRFARDEKLLSRVDRSGEAGKSTPKSACWIEDLYMLEGPEYRDPAWIESHSAVTYEAPASRALKAIVQPGGFPPRAAHREAIARFVAWQLVRGPDARAVINLPARFTLGLLTRMLGRLISRERLVAMLSEVGLPVDAATSELRQDPMLHVQTRTADALAATTRSMRLALVRFPDMALITSDRPVVPWDKIDSTTPPHGVGLDVPHTLSLHLDPKHALLFVPTHVCGEAWQERVIDGTHEYADVLNRRTAYWAWDRVFHHPDHTPMRGQPLPRRPSLDEELLASIDERMRAPCLEPSSRAVSNSPPTAGRSDHPKPDPRSRL